MFNLETYEIVNIIGLFIGILYGVISQKQQFCFSGSIKDYILTKSTKRAASVVMAMIVAIIATQIIASVYELDLKETSYYKENINYFVIILGGMFFGTGMIVADGCSNRHLIKLAQGDSKSIIALLFIGIFAYATTKGLLFGIFDPLINNPTLLKYSSYLENITLNIYATLTVLFLILIYLIKRISRITSLYDGVIIGLLVATAWSVTGVIGEDSMERIINLTGITFVYPTGKTLELFMYYQVNELSFAISLVCGVIIGAFFMSIINKKYSFGCTANQDIDRAKYNMIGGSLMGIGGVLSLGCTVGQGLTGLSTLALASFIAISSILISGTIAALVLNKYHKLPMCFIFEWKDNTPDYHI